MTTCNFTKLNPKSKNGDLYCKKERPRRNEGDTRTTLQKATDLKSIRNLEIPNRGTGKTNTTNYNSFTVLEHDYLIDIADKVNLSLGASAQQFT